MYKSKLRHPNVQVDGGRDLDGEGGKKAPVRTMEVTIWMTLPVKMYFTSSLDLY